MRVADFRNIFNTYFTEANFWKKDITFLKHFWDTFGVMLLSKSFVINTFNDTQRANISLFRVNNRNTIKRCEIWSELTIKTRERCQRCPVAFTVIFEIWTYRRPERRQRCPVVFTVIFEIWAYLRPAQCQRCPGVFIVIFEHISHLFLVFLLLTLSKEVLAGLHVHCDCLPMLVLKISNESGFSLN